MDFLKKTNEWSFMLMLISLLFIFPYQGVSNGAGVPSAEDVAFGKAPLPTIEELTGGKVKEGDLIDKNNMDLVKDMLTEGQIKCLQAGMVMRMANHKLKPLEGTPIGYNELTEKNRGKAVLASDAITVFYGKEGTLWPGGCPFPEPRSAEEVMANVRYGVICDDVREVGWLDYNNKNGKTYKKAGFWIQFIWVNTRSVIPPLGAWPGYEDQMYRKVQAMTSPLEVKGLGKFYIRYYDEVAKCDQGWYYHPKFKKTGRLEAGSWKTNSGGTDLTSSDGMGLQDPLVDWSFKYLGTKYILHAEFISDTPLIDDNARPVKDMQYDYGEKFPRLGYAAIPMHVIEGIPVVRHVYGKKMLYILTFRYAKTGWWIPMMDAYDRQMALWKHYSELSGHYDKEVHHAVSEGFCIWDLQSNHSTINWSNKKINIGLKPKDCTLKSLLAKGR